MAFRERLQIVAIPKNESQDIIEVVSDSPHQRSCSVTALLSRERTQEASMKMASLEWEPCMAKRSQSFRVGVMGERLRSL